MQNIESDESLTVSRLPEVPRVSGRSAASVFWFPGLKFYMLIFS